MLRDDDREHVHDVRHAAGEQSHHRACFGQDEFTVVVSKHGVERVTRGDAGALEGVRKGAARHMIDNSKERPYMSILSMR
jgi:hypothetical protein